MLNNCLIHPLKASTAVIKRSDLLRPSYGGGGGESILTG